MADKLMLRIITPDRVVLEEEVQEVVARAIDGELAILPNHEPLLTALGIDILRFKKDNHDQSAAVMGGVMEVNNNEVTVLSDLAELDHEIDEATAHQDKARLEAEKIQKVDKLDVHITELAIARSMARLKAAEYQRARRGRGGAHS
jgi:F-type H+-transporting ATPase subunit epsilon